MVSLNSFIFLFWVGNGPVFLLVSPAVVSSLFTFSLCKASLVSSSSCSSRTLRSSRRSLSSCSVSILFLSWIFSFSNSSTCISKPVICFLLDLCCVWLSKSSFFRFEMTCSKSFSYSLVAVSISLSWLSSEDIICIADSKSIFGTIKKLAVRVCECVCTLFSDSSSQEVLFQCPWEYATAFDFALQLQKSMHEKV